MKKSIHTLLTAALFATANVSAMPVMAGEGPTSAPPAEAAYDPASEQIQDVYGPPPSVLVDVTTTTTQLVYGTQPTTKLISETSTTTSVTNTETWTNYFTTTTTTAPQPAYGPPLQDFVGDVNFDGNVDSFDLVAVRKMLVKGTDKYSDAQMEAYYADMNNDKKLTIADLILLQEYVLGKVTKEELQQRFNYWFGSHDIEIEQITTSQDINTTTTSTTTTIYYPIQDTIVTLYGIAPSRNVREQMINPNRTTKTTANQPEQSEEK
ncbi:dockerin type I repeat-containing protein [Ruminococcus sp.]|uniref:dockerin type I repeat-containing protein n=1 Tax=Ruminococcus sp. TaxID=41978 RepID=UPI0025F2964A|nr:dockerin type I repeat-containing protein [Ruminococcus sp.]MCR4638399.1 dockerin type I repeat-containing protein [Ruminococcus sp.]